MSILLLGALVVAGLAGPLLRMPKRWGVPTAVGELLVGALFGASGFDKIPYQDPSLKLLATVGFALLMFTAGSHIDYRTLTKKSLEKATWILLLNFLVASLVSLLISRTTHFANWEVLAIISFSSSAALVIPLVEKVAPSESKNILIAQVTLADALAFMALPFFTQDRDQLKVIEGTLLVLIVSVFIFFGLKFAKNKGWLQSAHEISKVDRFGLELRISLALLLLVAALALHFQASVLIAGFTLGVVLASVGVPHRLARQLFGVSEGFFAPLYFVWLGASINIREVFHSRDAILLAVLLCFGALVAHIPSIFFGAPRQNILLSSAQLGVPAAAVTLGTSSGILTSAQAGAIMLSAFMTLLFTLKTIPQKRLDNYSGTDR